MVSALLWPTVLLGFLAACYTAFLFGQCEGRDLWQTPLLPVHLIVQALMCGAAVLALLPDVGFGGSAQTVSVGSVALVATVALHLLMLLGEVAIPHATDNALCRAADHAWPVSRRVLGSAVCWRGLAFAAFAAGGIEPFSGDCFRLRARRPSDF